MVVKNQFLKAFTILEVTIVMALMSLLIGIVFSAVNRFQEQLYRDQRVKGELSLFFVLRANLWQELDACDSVQHLDKTLTLFSDHRVISYKAEKEMLWRKENGAFEPVPACLKDYKYSNDDKGEQVTFLFQLEREEIQLRYQFQNQLTDRVNVYFNTLLNSK
jgi:hypothetical protein